MTDENAAGRDAGAREPSRGLGTGSEFTMYSTAWCGYCRRLKGALNREGITFDEVDIEADPKSADLVMSLNRGNATVPTLLFADGSSLTNPSPSEVKAKLTELAGTHSR